ncbi:MULTISPECIES: glyoxalase [unclassified Sphingomonas]|uniref:glyoxalase n=1 Tax=unclassified Sphingomonas TaxID=196159 RepID=UPI00092ACF9E|nr:MULTISPECIES: glyoxalase [unclassified Sphingomonas]MBN8850053.1 glyoxalase [Sphingomonas sp.]OJV32242.1 MAG: glyoxalase [Sphingomonas sp. 67-36]
MTVIGIERVQYRVDDLDLCARYFEDYGLRLSERRDDEVRFELPDNSQVVLRRSSDPVPGSILVGQGIHEVVWGVDTEAHLGKLIERIARDRDLRLDDEGVYHFVADGGIAMGLRHWHEKRAVVTSTDPVNSPGNINRMNAHRRWVVRARPRYMSHVVFIIPQYEECFAFLADRLDFRLADRQRGLGFYVRAPGTMDHHNLFLLNANSGFPGIDGTAKFHHINFAVTDLDEIMVGKNHMERKGWARSIWGVGRHRIASALFCYMPFPGGGEVEYGADSDALNDDWVPRDFDRHFGFAQWVHDIPEFWIAGPTWDVAFNPADAPGKYALPPAAALDALAHDEAETIAP